MQAKLRCKDKRVRDILERPAPKTTGAQFRMQIMTQLGLHGACALWCVRRNFGQGDIVELFVVPQSLMEQRVPSREFPLGSYRVTPIGSSDTGLDELGFDELVSMGTPFLYGATLDARDIHWIRLPHPQHLTDGHSPLDAGATWVDVADQHARAQWSSMRHDITPGVIIEQDDTFELDEDEERLWREEMRARHSGAENNGRDLILPQGVKAKPQQQRELDYTGSWANLRDQVLALYASPPVAIGVMQAGSRAAYYASLQQYIELAVQPLLDLVAYELGEIFGVEVELEAKSVDDPELFEKRLANDIKAGALTVNEYRKLRRLPAVPWGDERVGLRVAPQVSEPADAMREEPDDELRVHNAG